MTKKTAPLTSQMTGAQLDPEDGNPIFADGMSRKRWLDATKDQRKAKFIAELRTPDEIGLKADLEAGPKEAK